MFILPCFVIQKNMQWAVRGRNAAVNLFADFKHNPLIIKYLLVMWRINSPLQKVQIMQI
jgi:hypothetical protein